MMIPKRRETGRTGTLTRSKLHQDHIQDKFLPQIHHQALEPIVTAILISGFRIPTLDRRTSLWRRFPLQLHDATGWLADHAFLTSAIAKEVQALTFCFGYRTQVNLGVRSIGPDASESDTLLKVNRCDSGWWRFQLNIIWNRQQKTMRNSDWKV